MIRDIMLEVEKCDTVTSFTGDVKLKALHVIGGDDGQHPLELRL